MRFRIARSVRDDDIAVTFVVPEGGQSLAAPDQVDGGDALDDDSSFLIVEFDPLPAFAGIDQFLRVGVRFDFSTLPAGQLRLRPRSGPVGSVNFNVSLNAIARSVHRNVAWVS